MNKEGMLDNNLNKHYIVNQVSKYVEKQNHPIS